MTSADVSSRLAALSPEKRALLERALVERSAANAGNTAGPRPRTHSGPLPLTDAQRLLWLAEQMHPADAVYNVPIARRVRGEVDVRALARALTAIVAAHEALRTTFVEENGEPTQRVGSPWAVPVATADLTGLPRADRPSAAVAVARATASAPFDLSTGPLLRALVIRLGDETILLIVVHHLVFDGASIDLLLRGLSAAYERAVQGGEPVVPSPVLHTADFALWDQSPARQASIASSVAYWREYLAGASPEVGLLPEQPPGVPPSPARASIDLPTPLIRAVERTAAAAGATTFMVLLAAFEAMLYRYTDQDDLLVGVPVAGRAHPDVAGTIGHLTDTVVLRARVSADTPYESLLSTTREDVSRALEHQAAIGAALRGIREAVPVMAGGPQVLFGLQPARGCETTLGGVPLEPMPTMGGAAKFLLAINAVQSADCIRLTAEFSADRFSEVFVARFLSHYVRFLEAVVARPDSAVGAVDIISSDEREQLFGAWNATAAPYPADATLAALFEAQAARTPDATAVVSGGRVVTYAALDAAAERFATALRAVGVSPGAFVGVCMTRSEYMIATLLGIHKAGAAYVPLDPAYPAERLAFILADTSTRVVVSEQPILAQLPWLVERATDSADGPRVLLAEEVLSRGMERPLSAVKNVEARKRAGAPADVAYVIYTSGSTGRPKGVVIEHRNAVALVSWALTVFSREELRGVLAATSICFDLSVFEIFVTLSGGGTLVMARDALALPEAAALSPVPVTLVNTVPSAAIELLRARAIPASVRTVNLAGELLPQHVVEELYSLPHVDHVYDLYGPSEDTTYSTFVLRERGGRPSIGRPIANTRAYVLDPCRAPVPVGMPGELYLAGAGVARGYLNRPELTAERFLELRLATDTRSWEERVYRTGDRVRYLADGRLEYLGRFDHQVKLRGFRVELGEIEACLASHPCVQQAAVVVQERAGGDAAGPGLVGFYVARAASPGARVGGDGERDLEANVRSHLRRTLPAYMVPAFLEALPALPLTPTGKIDRKALAVRPLRNAVVAGTAPRNVVERAVADVWGMVLGRTVSDVEAAFLDLGGHSLLATRVVAQVARVFGINLSLRAFFARPTVAGHSAALLAADAIPGRAERIAEVFLQARGATTAPTVPSFAPSGNPAVPAGTLS